MAYIALAVIKHAIFATKFQCVHVFIANQVSLGMDLLAVVVITN